MTGLRCADRDEPAALPGEDKSIKESLRDSILTIVKGTTEVDSTSVVNPGED